MRVFTLEGAAEEIASEGPSFARWCSGSRFRAESHGAGAGKQATYLSLAPCWHARLAAQLARLRVLELDQPFAPDEGACREPCLQELANAMRDVAKVCARKWRGVLSGCNGSTLLSPIRFAKRRDAPSSERVHQLPSTHTHTHVHVHARKRASVSAPAARAHGPIGAHCSICRCRMLSCAPSPAA